MSEIVVIANAVKQSPARSFLAGQYIKSEAGDCFVAEAPRNDSYFLLFGRQSRA
jgi:hypothetical protein